MSNIWIDIASTDLIIHSLITKRQKLADCFFLSNNGTSIFFVLHVLPEHHQSWPRCIVCIPFLWNFAGIFVAFNKYSGSNTAWLLSLGHKKWLCFSMALAGYLPLKLNYQIMRKLRPSWGTTCLCTSFSHNQQPELTVRYLSEEIFR